MDESQQEFRFLQEVIHDILPQHEYIHRDYIGARAAHDELVFDCLTTDMPDVLIDLILDYGEIPCMKTRHLLELHWKESNQESWQCALTKRKLVFIEGEWPVYLLQVGLTKTQVGQEWFNQMCSEIQHTAQQYNQNLFRVQCEIKHNWVTMLHSVGVCL